MFLLFSFCKHMNLRTLLKIRSDQDVYESVNIDRAVVYTHLVFELVGILVFFLVEVDEVVCDAFPWTWSPYPSRS